MRAYPDHIHSVDDGKGLREVYVNGKRVDHCFYADTKKGICDYYPWPPKVHKFKKRIISRRLHGVVRVKWLNPV